MHLVQVSELQQFAQKKTLQANPRPFGPGGAGGPGGNPFELGKSKVIVGKKVGRMNLMWKQYMGVSKNRGIPKWMVYNGKPY